MGPGKGAMDQTAGDVSLANPTSIQQDIPEAQVDTLQPSHKSDSPPNPSPPTTANLLDPTFEQPASTFRRSTGQRRSDFFLLAVILTDSTCQRPLCPTPKTADTYALTVLLSTASEDGIAIFEFGIVLAPLRSGRSMGLMWGAVLPSPNLAHNLPDDVGHANGWYKETQFQVKILSSLHETTGSGVITLGKAPLRGY